MLAFVAGWLTPTTLFLLLNIVIGVIAVTSSFGSHKKPQSQHHPEHQPLARAPSFLERVSSINFRNYNFQLSYSETGQEPTTNDSLHTTEYLTHVATPQLERSPSLLERVKSIKFSSFRRSQHEQQEPDETDDSSEVRTERYQVKRSESTESRVSPEKIIKSGREKMVAVEGEEELEIGECRTAETTRIERNLSFGDGEVDAKADDFINKFKQQLRLQRLDSLLRYREMFHGKQKA